MLSSSLPVGPYVLNRTEKASNKCFEFDLLFCFEMLNIWIGVHTTRSSLCIKISVLSGRGEGRGAQCVSVFIASCHQWLILTSVHVCMCICGEYLELTCKYYDSLFPLSACIS